MTPERRQQAEVEQRLVGDGAEYHVVRLAIELLGDYHDDGHAPEEEHQRAQSAEKVHRTAPEARQEHDRDEVEVAFDGAFPAEFAVAVLACTVVYFLLPMRVNPAFLARIGM